MHRDIKPANLLVEKRPVTNSPNIRIADFGVSCYEKDLAVEASVGEQRTVGKVGTACFRAPEVVSFIWFWVTVRGNLLYLGIFLQTQLN